MSLEPVQIATYPEGIPDKVMAGKFLQISCDGISWLLFATRDEHSYHNQILGRFLGEQKVARRWVDEETLEFPTDRVRVFGGGRFHLNPAAGTLELWDNSQAYGRFDEQLLREQIVTAIAPWCDLDLIIR